MCGPVCGRGSPCIADVSVYVCVPASLNGSMDVEIAESVYEYSLTSILMCTQDWRGRKSQGAYFEVVPPGLTETFKFPLGEDSRKEILDVCFLAVRPDPISFTSNMCMNFQD